MANEEEKDRKLDQLLDVYDVQEPPLEFHRRVRTALEEQTILLRRHKVWQLVAALVAAAAAIALLIYFLPTGNQELSSSDREYCVQGVKNGFDEWTKKATPDNPDAMQSVAEDDKPEIKSPAKSGSSEHDAILEEVDLLSSDMLSKPK